MNTIALGSQPINEPPRRDPNEVLVHLWLIILDGLFDPPEGASFSIDRTGDPEAGVIFTYDQHDPDHADMADLLLYRPDTWEEVAMEGLAASDLASLTVPEAVAAYLTHLHGLAPTEDLLMNIQGALVRHHPDLARLITIPNVTH